MKPPTGAPVPGSEVDDLSRRTRAVNDVATPEPHGRSEFVLPEGVTVAEWMSERNEWQNPRIRGLLRCMRVLDGIAESNYAILHCSVKRLFEVWEPVKLVSTTLRGKVAPFLEGSSRIPALEMARQAARVGLMGLDQTVLADLESVPEQLSEESIRQLRRTLCAALEELDDYVKNTLSLLVANDPRSQFDVDYFLSKRFSRDIDEAEWLYSSVCALEEYLQELDTICRPGLSDVADRIRETGSVPTEAGWKLTGHILREVLQTLMPMLRAVAGVPGTRLDELELLEKLNSEISANCWILQELFGLGCAVMDRFQGSRNGSQKDAATEAVEVMGDRLYDLLTALERQMNDLATFAVIWRRGISQRRALLLTRDDHLGD